MSWFRFEKPGHRLVLALSVVSLFSVCLWFGTDLNTASAKVIKGKSTVTSSNLGTSFPGTGTGAIPDGGPGCGPLGAPLDISFAVSGLSGAPSNVTLDMTATHTWVGDLNVSLIAPNATEHVIFASTGSTTATGCGSSDNLGALYTFDNSGTGDWWAQGTPYPAGTYQTTSAGDVPGGGAPTDFNAAFAGVADPNGTWILRISDGGGGDTGAVSAANLTLTTGVAPVGSPNVDMDGDGKSDYVIARNVTPLAPLTAKQEAFMKAGSIREKLKAQRELDTPENNLGGPPPVGSTIQWWVNNTSDNSDTALTHGEAATDFLTPSDFDGDGKADIAVWRPVAASGPGGAFFYILNSSTNTVDVVDFGVSGDDPAIVGDYDGDGKSDPAVYRCPALGAGNGQCFFYYLGSAGSGITFVPWGFGETFDFFVSPGDFDGDGKYDFCVQRTNPSAAGKGQFVLLRSSDLGVEYVNWGNDTDIIVPGDYDGDGKADFMVSRTAASQRQYYLLDRNGGGTGASPILWGIAGDVRTPGDYDGDGKTDIAIWRASGPHSLFYVLRSSDGDLQSFEYGINGDAAPAGWAVH